MTQLDYFVFVAASVVAVTIDERFGWIIIGIWGAIKCLRLI